MAVECILLAIPLIVLVWFINTLGAAQGNISRFNGHSIQIQSKVVSSCSTATADSSAVVVDEGGVEEKRQYWVADIVTGIGAGIYEELIFRLILICVLMILFQNVLQLSRRNSIILAVLISAALFSAHHHIDFLTGKLNPRDQFNLAKFSFRTIAGVYFAVLFAIRGFGITAGTHAFYDIIATVMNAAFFQQ
jgi:membrane protease YdiL (CAAX protease family)